MKQLITDIFVATFNFHNAPVIVMTLGGGGGGIRDLSGSFVKEYVTQQRQFVILRFPVDGKFAITAAQVENLDVSDISNFFVQLI